MVFLWKHCGNGSWTRFMMAIIPGTANSYLSSTIYLRVEITFLHAFFCAFDGLLNAFYGRLCIKTSLLYKQRNRSIEMSIFHWLFYFTVYFNCPKQIDHKHIKSHILLSCTHTRPVVSERRNSKYVWYDSCERQRYLAMLLRQMVFFCGASIFRPIKILKPSLRAWNRLPSIKTNIKPKSLRLTMRWKHERFS